MKTPLFAWCIKSPIRLDAVCNSATIGVWYAFQAAFLSVDTFFFATLRISSSSF